MSTDFDIAMACVRRVWLAARGRVLVTLVMVIAARPVGVWRLFCACEPEVDWEMDVGLFLRGLLLGVSIAAAATPVAR